MNNKVYLLLHAYEYGEENEHEEIKTLGIYALKKDAVEARDRYYQLPGFSKYPKKCFCIQRYTLGKDNEWTDGFINWDDASSIVE